MKVYIITRTSFPHGMAATSRIRCYADALKLAGIDCEVVVYYRTEVYGKKAINTEANGTYNGVSFIYTSGSPLRSSNPLKRKIDDWYDKHKFLFYLRKHLKKGDVVLAYLGTDVPFSLDIINVAHECGAFYTRDLCELPYGTREETEDTIKWRAITIHKQFPLLDGVLSISETLADLARANCKKGCVIEKIPIMVDYDQYELADRSDEAEIPYIFHSGTLYEQKDGILGMIEAFGMALQQTEKQLHFISTGTIEKSPHAKEIKKLIEQYHLEGKLIFTGYLSNEELKDYLSKATLVIINKYKTQQNHYCFSTKLGEYLAAAKPVIITNVGEATNYLKDGESAYIIETEDTTKLADTIVDAIEHLNKRKRIATNGQQVCKQYFDYRSYASFLKKHIQKITDYNR